MTRALALLCVLALGSRAEALRQAPPGSSRPSSLGLVVLQDRAFELDEAACARLLGSRQVGPRVSISLRGSTTPSAIDVFAKAGGTREHVEIDPSIDFAGERVELAARLRAASSVTLAGGDYMGWYRLLMPGGKVSALGGALCDAQRSGTIVTGHGAAASFLGRWSFAQRASLPYEPRNPRRLEPDVLLGGLGLMPDFVIETSTRGSGSLSSLFVALIHDSPALALYLDGDVAWVYDGVARSASIEGSGNALVFHASVARKQRDALRGARLSLLRRGDRFDLERRSVPSVEHGFERHTDLEAAHDRIDAGILARELVDALVRLGTSPPRNPIELRGSAQRLTLWTDENSRLRAQAAGSPLALAEIAFDLEPAAE